MTHIFIGGFAHTAENMRVLARAMRLELETCRFLTPSDLSSPAQTAEYQDASPSTFATNLRTQLRDVEAGTIYAWSIGGMFSIEFCHFFPAVIERLVLISSCASFVVQHDYLAPRETSESVNALAKAVREKPELAYTRFLRRCFGDIRPSREEFERHVAYALSLRDSDVCLDYLARQDLRDYARNLDIPVAIYHGSSDQIIHVDVARSLQADIPGSGLYVFEGMGHNLPFQCAARIADSITQNSHVRQ